MSSRAFSQACAVYSPFSVLMSEIGITTIVDLRAEDSSLRERERIEAEAFGVRFISIPLGGFSRPAKDQITTFLLLFAGHSPGAVFLHCRLGEDRTGVFVAAYRIAIDHWTVDEAIKKMHFFGFNRFWHPAMVSYIRDFPALVDSDPALNTLSSSSGWLRRLTVRDLPCWIFAITTFDLRSEIG